MSVYKGPAACSLLHVMPPHNTVLSYLMQGRIRGADNSLARPGKKQATATEDFEFHVSYL